MTLSCTSRKRTRIMIDQRFLDARTYAMYWFRLTPCVFASKDKSRCRFLGIRTLSLPLNSLSLSILSNDRYSLALPAAISASYSSNIFCSSAVGSMTGTPASFSSNLSASFMVLLLSFVNVCSCANFDYSDDVCFFVNRKNCSIMKYFIPELIFLVSILLDISLTVQNTFKHSFESLLNVCGAFGKILLGLFAKFYFHYLIPYKLIILYTVPIAEAFQ